MFKGLISTCLLLFSCSGQPKQVEEDSSRLETPQRLRDISSVLGAYNWRNSFDSSRFTDDLEGAWTLSVDEGDEEQNAYNLCPSTIDSTSTSQQLYLSKIEFDVTYDDVNDDWSVDVDLYFYDLYYSSFPHRLLTFDDVENQGVENCGLTSKLIMYFRTDIVLHDELDILFNAFFTSSDNIYTTTYNGYYSFNNGLTAINRYVDVYGSIVFNSQFYSGFTNREYSSYSVLAFYSFNPETDAFYLVPYNLPFDNVSSQNLIFSGVKMTKDTYNYLNTVGVFAYVRDTTWDDSDFGDLLFSIMDAPVYYITRLLSFELFGVNMFVAFTGLLTICLVLVLIRRFF